MLVNQVFMKVARRWFRYSPFDMFILAKARAVPCDVVHVHDLPILKHGATIAAERGVPLVFDSHEIYHEQEGLTPRDRRILKKVEQRYIPQCELFFTVNEAIADYFEELHGKRPGVLLNCADTPAPGFDTDSRATLRKRADLAPDSQVVLYQGWISAERNLATLVRAAEAFPPDTYLVMIGYGAYEPELKAIVENEPWADRVRFLGRVEPAEMLPLTAGADLGVIPYQPIDLNHRLCSPNKFFEYVQAGVPVLSHQLPFFEGMAARYGVVATGDLSNPHDMTAAITRVLNDPGRLAKMKAACQPAAEELNWEHEGRKLVDAYARLAAAARG
jgi:glycosyltransferase involved in cell wall biosynthesis